MFLAPLIGAGAAASASAAAGLGATTFAMGAPAALGVAAPVSAAAAIGGLTPSLISMSTLMTGLAAGSSLLRGVGGYRAGQAQAGYLQAQARSELGAGAVAGQRQAEIERAKLGELRATMGASGVQMSGSPMMVYMDSVKNAALNVQDKIYQGKLAAWSSTAQAGFARREASSSLWSGIIGAGTSLAGGMGGFGSLGSRLLQP